ncbi:hypothetical protein AYO44_01395 [Planctomycetaceae bacterium SCGC AG-212-F19]|nr:hypothetical protein AYO44_01395 [Planctomycetaceae bacterium SCGC AG-212-F19]
MAFRMQKIQVWAGDIPDRPGAAAAILERLAHAGVDLEFVLTRPRRDNPEASVIFLAPIVEPDHIQAAKDAGLAPARDIAMLCLEGENRPGIGYDIMSRIAVAGINLRGLSVSTVEHRFVTYLAFDNADDLTQAIRLLATLPD